MAHAEQQLLNYIPENVLPGPLLYHPHDHAWQNVAGIPPVAGDGKREDHWEDIPLTIKSMGQAQRPPAFPAISYNLGINDHVPLQVENMAIEDQAEPLHNAYEAHYNEIPPAPAHAPDNRRLEGHEPLMGPSQFSTRQKNEKAFSLLCTLKSILGFKPKMNKRKGWL